MEAFGVSKNSFKNWKIQENWHFIIVFLILFDQVTLEAQ